MMNFEELAREAGRALAESAGRLHTPTVTEITSRRRRGRLAAGVVGVSAILVGAVALAGTISVKGPVVPSATADSTNTTVEAEETPVTVIDLLDGSRLEVVGPADLELTGYRFLLDQPEFGGETKVYVTPDADPADAAASESAGFESDLGEGVQLWRGVSEGRPVFMSVDLGGWVVFLHVGSDSSPDSASLLSLAEELRGDVTDHGVILPNHDLEAFTTYLGTPGTEDSIHLGIGECLREVIPGSEVIEHPALGEVIRGENYASWCDADNDVEARVHGAEAFVLRNLGGLTIHRSAPPPRPAVEGDAITAFHPAVEVGEDVATLEVSFTDGTSATLTWPSELALASGGLSYEAAAYTPTPEGSDGRSLVIYRGPLQRIKAQLGEGTLLDEYPGAYGSTVQFWRFQGWEWDYLLYEFGDWMVMVYDYRVLAAARMSGEERSMWARSLTGQETEAGFLVLDAKDPLRIGGPEFPWPPGIVLHSPGGDIRLQATTCEATGPQEVGWCDDTGLIWVSTPSETGDYARTVRDNLRITDVQSSPDRPNPSTTSTPSPTTTTAATLGEESLPLVTEIALDQSIPLRVLAIRPNNPSFAVIDLEAGDTTLYPPGAHALPRDAVGGAVMTPDREWISWTNGIARLLSGPLDHVDVVLGPDEPRSIPGIAPALRALPTPDSQRVWLVQPGIDLTGQTEPTIVELVEAATGRSLLTVELEANTFPVAATNQGLIFNSHDVVFSGDGWVEAPGSFGVALLTEDGAITDLGGGSAVAATADKVVLASSTRLILRSLSGDPDVTVEPPHDGVWEPVGGPVIPSDAVSLQTVSPDGSQFLIALGTNLDVNRQPSKADLIVVDLIDGTTRTIEQLEGRWPAATWSADGEWIATFQANDIYLIKPDQPETKITLTDVIPADHFPLAAG